MLEGFPEKVPARRGSTTRNVVLTVVAAVAGLAVIALVGSVFGVFDALRSGSGTSASTTASSALASEKLDPAPELVCQTGTVHEVPAPSGGSGTGDDTPLAAAERWAASVPGASDLVDARQYAAPASMAGTAGGDTARTFAWYDHDGVLHAEVTVIPAASGAWTVGAGSYCA